jgi:hypothetical protein
MKIYKNHLKVFWTIPVTILVVFLFAVVLIGQSPQYGAQAADWLRPVIGAAAVAKLEEAVFVFKDNFTQFKYQVGMEKPQAPWVVTIEPTYVVDAIPTAIPQNIAVTAVSIADQEIMVSSAGTPTPAAEPPIVPTPAPTPWQPPAPLATGRLPGEGTWSSYLRDSTGSVLAYRTFFQPDPKRPTTIVAVVAFDLTRSRLHFVLGTQEPGLKGGPRGSGKIDAEYLQPGVILAAFSGGFQTVHGKFGAMSDRIVAVPPREGLATVAIYEDGRVSMGEWGKKIMPSDDIIAWRQNCVLVIHNGIITEKVFNDKIADWGGTLDGQIVTMRSGLGISADEKTLYYFAGPGLGVPALATAMAQVGVADGMQLEINNFWTHFVAISADGPLKWKVGTLLPEAMNDQPERFLKEYTRDFFYVTAVSPDTLPTQSAATLSKP